MTKFKNLGLKNKVLKKCNLNLSNEKEEVLKEKELLLQEHQKLMELKNLNPLLNKFTFSSKKI